MSLKRLFLLSDAICQLSKQIAVKAHGFFKLFIPGNKFKVKSQFFNANLTVDFSHLFTGVAE